MTRWATLILAFPIIQFHMNGFRGQTHKTCSFRFRHSMPRWLSLTNSCDFFSPDFAIDFTDTPMGLVSKFALMCLDHWHVNYQLCWQTHGICFTFFHIVPSSLAREPIVVLLTNLQGTCFSFCHHLSRFCLQTHGTQFHILPCVQVIVI